MDLAPVPLVLIHGMSAGPAAWAPVLPLLEDAREVHVLTLVGHRGGRSIADPGSFDSSGYVDAVEAELDRIGVEVADLVGNSLGGWVALQLAARGRARSVVCLAPAGGWAPGSWFDRFLTAQFAGAHRLSRRVATPAGRRLLFRPVLRRQLLRALVAAPERVSDAAYLTVLEDLAGCSAVRVALGRPAARDVSRVPASRTPVLIAWSGRDRVLVSGRIRRALERQLDRPEVIRLPGVGHVPMSDAPALVAATVLEFTARVSAPGSAQGRR